MLLNESDFSGKEINKIVKNINQYHNKNKLDKMEAAVGELDSFLKDKDSDECRQVVYIYSHLAEKFPNLISKKVVKQLEELIQSKNDETRLNSIILYGTKFIERIKSEEVGGEEIDKFINLVNDPILEVQGNIVFFIEQFPEDYYDYLLEKLSTFMNILDSSSNPEVTDALLFIIDKIWQKTLSIQLSIFNTLLGKYFATPDKEKQIKIIKFLAKALPDLEDYVKKASKIDKDEVQKIIKSRGPMIKIYNIEQIAKSEGMNVKDVEKNFEKIVDDQDFFRFPYQDKKKYFIEIELKPLVEMLNKGKVKVDDLIHIFGDKELDQISLLNILIKKLVKAKLVKGFLTKSHFLPYDYLKESLLSDLRKTGQVNLDEYAKSISHEFVLSIADDINKETKFNGIYTKNKSLFISMATVFKEIENKCTKESMFDLSDYKETYAPEDYTLIENKCKTELFTKYHSASSWLTNIGYTRLTNRFKEGSNIGFINVVKIVEEQDIPSEIARAILKQWLEGKPGLWDKSENIYYFTKYIKQKLGKVDKSASDADKNKMVEALAQELNIEKALVQQKLKQEIEDVIQQLKNKPSIDINTYIKALDMKREQFVEFVNGLKIEYIIIGKDMIFDPKQIEKKKKEVNEIIGKAAEYDEELDVKDLSNRLKFSEHNILEMIKNYYSGGKLKGFFLTKEIFLTEKGLRKRILQNKDLISMQTLFDEDTKISEKDQKYVISVLEEMVNKGELIGSYDDSTKEFRSEEGMTFKQYDEDKTNAEQLLKLYRRYMQETFDKVREMYMDKPDVKPGDIKRKDYLIKRIMDEVPKWERALKKSIEKAEQSFDTMESAGEMTFGEVLDIQDSKNKIDGDRILAEYGKWKQAIVDLEQNVDKIGAIKKKLKDNPDDETLKKDLQGLYDKLHFSDRAYLPPKMR